MSGNLAVLVFLSLLSLMVATEFSTPSSSSSTTSSSSSSGSSSQTPSSEAILGHIHYKRAVASSFSDMMSPTMKRNHSRGPGHHHSNITGSSSTPSPSSATPGALNAEIGHHSTSPGPDHHQASSTVSPMPSRSRRHTSHRVGHESYAPYYRPSGCYYEYTTTTPPPTRDVLCIRDGRLIFVGDGDDQLCFEAPVPETSTHDKIHELLHEKEDLFKLFKTLPKA